MIVQISKALSISETGKMEIFSDADPPKQSAIRPNRIGNKVRSQRGLEKQRFELEISRYVGKALAVLINIPSQLKPQYCDLKQLRYTSNISPRHCSYQIDMQVLLRVSDCEIVIDRRVSYPDTAVEISI